MITRPPYQWSVYTIDPESVTGKDSKIPRHVLIVSRESANEALPVVTVLPLVRRRKGRKVYPNEAFLPSGAAGLKRDCIAMAHQTRTVPKRRLADPLGTIEDDDLRAQIRRAMCIQLHLEPG